MTAQPSPHDGTDKVATMLDFVDHRKRRSGAAESVYYLSGDDETDRVELTPELFSLLKAAAEALQRGQSVTLHRRDQELTTQQAADLLGLSRPTIVKLIENGVLPASIPGAARRKLRLADVLDYERQLHEERSAFIARSADEYADEDPEEINAELAALRQRK